MRAATPSATAPCQPAAADLLILRSARERNRIVKKNAGASLVDLGDGVFCVEFHSKMNAIGGDTIQMLQAGSEGSVAATVTALSSATTRRISRPAPT